MSDGASDDGRLALDTIFTEPPRPPSPEPTIVVYGNNESAAREESDDVHLSWSSISVRLVGSHPLWGHYLWNSARALSGFLQRTPELYRGRTVLELGAGGGLPSLVAAKCGARKVVMTDYPDQALIENMAYNVAQNIEPAARHDGAVSVMGYVWGQPVEPLLALLESEDGRGEDADGGGRGGFDLILLSDLIFNHSQHRALLNTCERAIAPHGVDGGCVLVFYTHHRPHLAQRDMAFFEMARDTGWTCEKVVTEWFPPMFPEDPGEEEVRSTVHGWKLTRK